MGLCLYIDTPDAPRVQEELLFAYRLLQREPVSSPARTAVEAVIAGLDARLATTRWQSSYSYFGTLRGALAAALGVALIDVWAGDPKAITSASGALPLFDHSDCDGELSAQECASIVEALAPVLPRIEEDLRDEATALVEFLAQAATTDSTVVFA